MESLTSFSYSKHAERTSTISRRKESAHSSRESRPAWPTLAQSHVSLASVPSCKPVKPSEPTDGSCWFLSRNEEYPLFPPHVELSAVWTALVSGACFIIDSHYSEEHCFVIVEQRKAPPNRSLTTQRVAILERILLGASQKTVAIHSGLSVSTVSLACTDCLRTIGRNHLASKVPMLLVMAVHAAHGVKLRPAQAYRISESGSECWLLRAARPDRHLPPRLTPAEQQVTRLLGEGHAYARIAEQRRSSPRTIASQVASAFRKLEVSSRTELLSSLTRTTAIGSVFEGYPSDPLDEEGVSAGDKLRLFSRNDQRVTGVRSSNAG